MKKGFSFVWLALLYAAVLAAPVVVHAQGSGETAEEQSDPLREIPRRPRFLVGPRFGGNRNFHSGGFRTINESNCPKFDQGSGFGFLAGLTAEFLPMLNANWSIIPAVTFESRPGSFTQSLPDVKVLLEGQLLPVNQTIETSSDVTYQIINAEVLYKYEFLTIGKSIRVSAAAGPAFGYVMGGTISQYQDLINPPNARFLNEPDASGKRLPTANNGRRLIFANNEEIPGRSSTRFSLKAGLQGELGLFNNKLIMYPGAFFDYGLTDVTTNEPWNLNTLVFQVDFRYAMRLF